MFRKVLLSIFLLTLSMYLHAQQDTDPQQRWVDSVYQSLDAEQRLGQLFLLPVHGAGGVDHIGAVRNTIERYALGGVFVMDGTINKTARSLYEIQQVAALPIFKAAYIDEGLASTLSDVQPLPNALTLGAIRSDSLINAIGIEINNQLTSTGINMPVHRGAALARRKDNDHSFSTDPELTALYMNKLETTLPGKLVVWDLFPGVYDKAMAKGTLSREYQRPYREAGAVMLRHEYSGYDSKYVASLSRATVSQAKDKLIIASDFSDMKRYRPGRTEEAALLAGNDMVVSSNVTAAINRLKKKYGRDENIKNQLDQKVKKILRKKYLLRSYDPLPVTNAHLKVNNPLALALDDMAYRYAATVIDPAAMLPISNVENLTCASYSIGDTQVFQEFIGHYTAVTHYNQFDNKEDMAEILGLYDQVFIGIEADVIRTEDLKLIQSLPQDKLVICLFGNPYLAAQLPPAAMVISYAGHRIAQRVAAEVIFGAIAAQGQLPVQINKRLTLNSGATTHDLGRISFGHPEEVGMDSRTLERIDQIAREAISDRATPGCQVLVARKGQVVFYKPYGYFTYDSITPVQRNTIYDLASITKVGATTQAVMFLEEQGMLDLDKKISVYLPDLVGTNKENMIIRDILSHQAGLWPYLPFWKQTVSDSLSIATYYRNEPVEEYQYQISDGLYASDVTRDSVWQWVKSSKLRDKEEGVPYDYRYSDMGYYMLQRVVENMTSQPIEEFLQHNFYDPLGLANLSYRPLCKAPITQITPTEYDTYFRNSLVYGMVHDQGAAMMGGVAGHAGLFGNALDLAKLIQMNLNGGTYGGLRYFKPETLAEFTAQQYENSRRGVGWDKPVTGSQRGPASYYASYKTFGHTGFTGTAVWADPEFDLIYVFLSNRIYPDATNSKLIKTNIRTRIQDLIYQSMWNYSSKYGGGCN